MTAAASGPVPAVDPATRELEEERDFLLRSLADLEAEHDAHDIDDVDYRNLKDDYTARAAAVLRALESPPDRPVEPGPSAAPGSGYWCTAYTAFSNGSPKFGNSRA